MKKIGIKQGLGLKLNAVLSLSAALVIAISFISIRLPAAAQEPVDHSFSFQGRLRQAGGGGYVTGACDFRFSLYDADLPGGTRLGNPQTVTDVTVRDGYFAAALDFGPVFSAEPRYLAIEVNCPANGGAGPYTDLGSRAKLNAIPYAIYAADSGQVSWPQLTNVPAGFADQVDDEGLYTNGPGLSLNNNQFGVITPTLINPTNLQERIAGSCPPGQTIQAVNADGTVVCLAQSAYYQGSDGLKITRTDALGNPILEPDFDVAQERIDSPLCGGSGQAIRKILATGEVECEPIPQGDLTAIQAGSGLSGGGTAGSVTILVGDQAITTSHLANSSVNAAKLADGTVSQESLAASSVDGGKIADGGVQLVDLAQNGCVDGYRLLSNGGYSWICNYDIPAYLSPGNGIYRYGTDLSAYTGSGLRVTGDKITADFLQANSSTTTGNAGSAETAVRSDHDHNDRYVALGTAYSGDVTGNFQSGLKVTHLQGVPVSDTPPENRQILWFNGSQWAPLNYGFPLEIAVVPYVNTGGEPKDGQIWATCPDTTYLVGGGCYCNGDDIEKNYPLGSQTWYCDCSTASNEGNIATAKCMQRSFGQPVD